MAKKIEETITDIINPALIENDLFLWDLNYNRFGKNNVLAIRIDGNNHRSLNMEQITKISQEISELLDVTDPIEDAYMLDISTPGAERSLQTMEHYNWALNQVVEIKLFKPINKQKVFRGQLINVDDSQVVIELEDQSNLSFKKQDIANANIII